MNHPFKGYRIQFKSTHFVVKSIFLGLCFQPLLFAVLKFSFLWYSYQKDERAKPENLRTNWCFSSHPNINYLSLHPWVCLSFSRPIYLTSLSFFLKGVVATQRRPPTTSHLIRHSVILLCLIHHYKNLVADTPNSRAANFWYVLFEIPRLKICPCRR